MKKVLLTISFSLLYFLSKAQSMENLATRLTEIEDRISIKNLVDTFSILADRKEVDKQVQLFTEDATVQAIVNGTAAPAQKGRKEIGAAFSGFLSRFQTVYHINGQQTLTLHGTTASGISYCAVTLIGTENGRTMKTDFGIYYHDEYVKQNGHWLIANRISTFA